MRKLRGIAAILVVGALWGASTTLADPPPAATSPEVPPTVVDMVPLSNGPTVPGPNAIMLAPVDSNGVFVELGRDVQDRLRSKGWRFYAWGSTGCRLMCAWDTAPETVERFTDDLAAVAGA